MATWGSLIRNNVFAANNIFQQPQRTISSWAVLRIALQALRFAHFDLPFGHKHHCSENLQQDAYTQRLRHCLLTTPPQPRRARLPTSLWGRRRGMRQDAFDPSRSFEDAAFMSARDLLVIGVVHMRH